MAGFMFEELSLKGAYCIRPFHAEDNRGCFVKDYNRDLFLENGINHELKETFFTTSKRGVVRAIHFQLIHQQAKLVRCISGQIYDILVDLRPWSNTFGKWQGFYLSGENYLELYVPEYFGHGYLVLEDSIVSYKANENFDSAGDSGIIFDDPVIGIKWPLNEIGGKGQIILSEKDRNLMSFDEYKKLDIKEGV